MFESLFGSIKEGFSNLLPHEFCVPCFLKGLAEGIGFGVLTIGLLAAVATFAAPIAGAVALVLAIAGIAGLAYMAANWKNMDDRQKSEALGGVIGGAFVGGTSGGMEVPMPAFEPVLQPGGTLAMEMVATEVAVSPAATSAVGAGIGGGGAAMMSGTPRDGGDEGPSSDYVDENPRSTPDEQRVGRSLNSKAKAGELPGVKEVRGAPESDIKGTRSGDYRFIDQNGKVTPADLYQPESANPQSISSNIREKSGQAEIVVVELGKGNSGGISDANATQIAQSAVGTPGHGVERVIVTRPDGRIITDQQRP